MLSFQFLAFILTPTLSFLSVDPTWLTSTFLKSESWKLIDGDSLGRTVGPSETPTATMTFTGTPFTDIPNLGYGISKYEGHDSFYNQKFEVNRTGLTATSFSVLIQIQGSTYLWVLQIRYIAINLMFPHKLVSFDNVPVNYGAGNLNNITIRRSYMQMYTNNINFTKQAIDANSNYTTFPTPLDKNKILLFLTSLYIQGDDDTASSPIPLNLEVTAIPITYQTYQLKVNFGIKAEIQRLHYSMIVFNQDDVESSGLYTLVYQRVDFTKDGGTYQFQSQFSDNFIISFTDFSSPRILVAVDFKTNFGVLPNGKNGIIMKQSKPRNNQYLTPLSRFGFTVFYMKTWKCPDQTFFNLVTNKCEGCPVYFCIDCQNLTVCKQCEPGYQLTAIGDECYVCNQLGCQACSAPSVCSDCNETSGFILLSNSSCKLCDKLNNYFPDTNSETCQICVLSQCLICLSLQECSECNIANNFTLNTSTLLCQYCDYLTNNFVNNTQQCQLCSLSQCLICQTLFSCLECNVSSMFHLNQTNNLCELCTLQGCLECASLTACLICNETSNYWINITSELCGLCLIQGCLECSSIDVCKICNISGDYGHSLLFPNLCATCNTSCICDGYYFPWLGTHCSPICGDGLIRVDEQCDDNNTEKDDGCSNNCKIERNYACIGEPSNCISVLFIQSKFLRIVKNGCNGVIVQLEIEDLSLENLEEFVVVQNFEVSIIKTIQIKNLISIYLQYQQGYHGQDFKLGFEPGNMLTIPYSPAIPAVYYNQGQCKSAEQISSLMDIMQIFSYFILIISILSCKIVGLELFGVLQLSYFTLGSHDFINIYLSPLVNFKTFNGLNLLFLPQSSTVPSSLTQMKVYPTFLNNCNIMLLLLACQLIVGFVMWIIGRCVRMFIIAQFGLRLLKQGFITLIIFNVFNIGFSIGIDSMYAEKIYPKDIWNKIVMVIAISSVLVATLVMQVTTKQHYGEFKNKFKSNYVCALYIPFTICFRLFIAFYTSIKNQFAQSTLITLSFSLMFLIYVCVNTPFINVYQNYRSVLIHCTMFFTLLVTNFYRNMKSTTPLQIKAKIFVPALIELVLIVVCIAMSLIILIYQIYQLVRQWRLKSKRMEKVYKNEQQTEESVFYLN